MVEVGAQGERTNLYFLFHELGDPIDAVLGHHRQEMAFVIGPNIIRAGKLVWELGWSRGIGLG